MRNLAEKIPDAKIAEQDTFKRIKTIKSTNILFTLILAASLTLLTSCGGESSTSNESSEFPIVSEDNYKTLRATIKLKELPNVLITGDVSRPDRLYVGVHFDINNDGVISYNDLALMIEIGTNAETGDEKLMASLTQFRSSPREGYYFIAEVDYETNIDELTFVVQKDQAAELSLISQYTQINVKVAIWNDEDNTNSADYLPALNIYTQVQDVSLITDDLFDYEGNNDTIDISEFKLLLE